MSGSWDDTEVFRVPDIAWQTHAPPTRHAVPVRYVPDLEAGDEVTIGLPGHYFIDGQIVALDERGQTTLGGHAEEREAVAVAAPYAYWLAKGFPTAGLTMQWWPVDCSWVYRDALPPSDASAHERPIGQREDESWLQRVRPTLDEPPSLRPRPAREATTLTGRTLRLQHEPGEWSWWVGVGEPIDVDGDFVVHIMRPSDYWLAQVAFEPPETARAVPLHRLFTYA